MDQQPRVESRGDRGRNWGLLRRAKVRMAQFSSGAWVRLLARGPDEVNPAGFTDGEELNHRRSFAEFHEVEQFLERIGLDVVH